MRKQITQVHILSAHTEQNMPRRSKKLKDPPGCPAPPPPMVWEPTLEGEDYDNCEKLKDKQAVPVWVFAISSERLLYFSPPYPCDASCLEVLLRSYFMGFPQHQLAPNSFFFLEFADGLSAHHWSDNKLILFPKGHQQQLEPQTDIQEIVHVHRIGKINQASPCRLVYKEIPAKKEKIIQKDQVWAVASREVPGQ